MCVCVKRGPGVIVLLTHHRIPTTRPFFAPLSPPGAPFSAASTSLPQPVPVK